VSDGRGRYVRWGRLHPPPGPGGRGSTFRVDSGGKRYLIDDLYCVNPRCKCKEVVLAFFEHDEGAGRLTQVFDVALAPGANPRFEHGPVCTPYEAGRVFRRWRESDPEALEAIEARRVEMKEVGRRLAAKFRERCSGGGKFGGPAMTGPARTPKPGRNDPCPCGSGKKYKRCCMPRPGRGWGGR